MAKIECELKKSCSENELYFRWLNSRGAYEFELITLPAFYDFEKLTEIIKDSRSFLTENQNKNSATITENAEIERKYKLSISNILAQDKEKYLDFIEQVQKNDIDLFVSKYLLYLNYVEKYDNGFIKYFCKNHCLITGDEILINSILYKIIYFDDNNFFTMNAPEEDLIAYKKLLDRDWKRCKISNIEHNFVDKYNFNINLEIIIP